MDNPKDVATIQDVKALFGNLECGSQKGMLTWILQKKLEADPSHSIPLINVLIYRLKRKINKMNETHKVNMSIIPMLHTLHYAVIQSGVVIPICLYQRVAECLKELLKLPSPHSAVALNTLSSITMEMSTPGFLYWRKVLAEQNLKHDHSSLQEKVFVFADPAVFSPTMEARVKAYLKVSSFFRNENNVEKKVIMHVLQAGIAQRQRTKLAFALEALDEAAVTTFFEELNVAVRQSSTSAREEYLNTLQKIYSNIMAASESVSSHKTEGETDSPCSTTLPYPDFEFVMWEKDDEFWDKLAEYTLRSSSLNRDEENPTEKRDSGIEKDIKESLPNETPLKRRKPFKRMMSKGQLILISEKMKGATRSSSDTRRTARVVFMGDDRVLGKLAKAYHAIRKKESKHNILTKKLNLQLYYIPVSDDAVSAHDNSLLMGDKMSLASYLGKIDPWYQRNILDLRDPISNPLNVPSVSDQPSQLDLYMLDTMCYYLRCGSQPANLPVYSVKIFTSEGVVEEVFVSHLQADIPGCKESLPKRTFMSRRWSNATPPGASVSVSYKKLTISQRDNEVKILLTTFGVEITSKPAASTSDQDSLIIDFDCFKKENKGIKAESIVIRATDHWRFSVCLDRDSDRTYQNVLRMDVAPCLDPGCDIRPLHGSSRELLLSKYLDEVLSLPINTFTGVTV